MPGLTNQYITDLGKKICGKSFLGVYPCDIQPQFQERYCKFSIVFNTDKHNEEGEHFVAIYCDREKIIYFDSFGEKCKNKNIKKFIKLNLNGRKFNYNKKCIQDNKSLFCGLYCLSFIMFQNNNISLCKYLKYFSTTNLLSNDKLVTKIITNEI